jgi:hypothetical protein
MFRAVGVGVKRNGTKYDVRVDYQDDRVTPPKSVGVMTHTVATQAELLTAVNAQLQTLKDNDREATLSAAVAGKVLGTI